MEKQEKKEGKRKALTANREATIEKREVSFEGLASSFENGEDGVYNLITNDKHVIFRPKISITKRDIESVPFMAELQDAIAYWDNKVKTSEGKNKYIAKKALIESRKDQYLLKASYQAPITLKKVAHSRPKIELPCEEWVEHGESFADLRVRSRGASLMNPTAISAILCNYSRLKQESSEDFENETWYFMQDFDNLCEEALGDYPVYNKIVECKIDGMTNGQIQEIVQKEFGLNHSAEYISTIWRNKIPYIIASKAEDQFLDWYFLTQEKGVYKRCSKCGEVKLALPKYFSKNNTSKDNFYSVCKKCRNKK